MDEVGDVRDRNEVDPDAHAKGVEFPPTADALNERSGARAWQWVWCVVIHRQPYEHAHYLRLSFNFLINIIHIKKSKMKREKERGRGRKEEKRMERKGRLPGTSTVLDEFLGVEMGELHALLLL